MGYYDWLSRSTGITDQNIDIVQMKGSTSSSVFLVQSFLRDSHPSKFVLRVLDNQKWLAEEPDLAVHEAAALEEAQKAGVRSPHLVAYSSNDVGFGGPVVLMSYIEGKIELRPSDLQEWLDNLASQLVSIHHHTAEAFPWRFRSWAEKANLAPPKWTTVPRLWERAIELALGPEPAYHPVFIHRDYHPANILWKNGSVNGVVDWINACQGPAGVDVAHCRTNLALMFGPTTADQFLDAYIQVADRFTYEPYWDVDSILDGCIPEPSFYEPWQEFGLGIIAPRVLRQRIDGYLERVMMRVD